MSSESIRTTRQQLRISQSELSRLANVSRWKLNVFELGEENKLDAGEISRIEAVLRKEAQGQAAALAQ